MNLSRMRGPGEPGDSEVDLLGHTSGSRCEGDGLQPIWGTGEGREPNSCLAGPGAVGELGDSAAARWSGAEDPGASGGDEGQGSRGLQPERTSGNNFWSPCTWLPCRDGKFRPTKPGLSPLAHGVSRRVPQLRAIGNSIVPQVAAEFICAIMAASPCPR